MPRAWHDRHAANKIEDDTDRGLYRNIVADKKPYFMRYIYPALMKQYNTYIKNTNKKALREFQMTVSEIKKLNKNELTDRQSDFLRYFDYRMPVGTGDCVMNKICRRFENEFDKYISKCNSDGEFDYSIMRSNSGYSISQYKAIKKLYEDYNHRIRNYAVFAAYERIDECDSASEMLIMNEEFRRECNLVCQNSATLCDIILDLCYTRNATKRFAWSLCGHDIIHNLLKINNNTISFPKIDIDGEIKFCGETFTIVSTKLGGENDYCIERK